MCRCVVSKCLNRNLLRDVLWLAVMTMSTAAIAQSNVTISGRFQAGFEIYAVHPALATPYPLGSDTVVSNMGGAAADTMLNGAHSMPLSRRVNAGEKTFWVAGDWGKDEHSYRNGDLGLAEIGWGHNYGSFQFNASLGKTKAEQDFQQSNTFKAEGTYLYAELLMPISGSLWAVLGGYGHWGENEFIRKGAPDTQLPNSQSLGLRARLEWDKIVRIGNTGLSPYADLSFNETRIAAHTEFLFGSLRIKGSREKSTELRLGLNASLPLTDTTKILGAIEATHRFEKSGAKTTAKYIGGAGFELPGREFKQDWLRVGAGVEGKLGNGVASLMLNATTQGEMPNIWLAASWQTKF